MALLLLIARRPLELLREVTNGVLKIAAMDSHDDIHGRNLLRLASVEPALSCHPAEEYGND